MTIHSSLRDVFDIYAENYPGKPCSGGSKRAFIQDQLIPTFNQLGQELPDDIIKDRSNRTQLDRYISINMAVSRNYLICPQRTNTDYEEHEIGSENSISGKRAKQKNDKQNKKRKEENRLAVEEYLRTHFTDQYHELLTQDAAVAQGKTILDKSYPELGNVSIQEFLRNNPFAGLYVGMTSQILKVEDRKWLSFRGRHR
jgi:hypothetical protein